MYVFNIIPVAKPRQTQSDKWNERKPVMMYCAFKQELQLKANLQKYHITVPLIVDFYMPMPKTWGVMKRAEYRLQPHTDTPDIDNFIKAFMDALETRDEHIYDIHARKFWDFTGRIEIFTGNDPIRYIP